MRYDCCKCSNTCSFKFKIKICQKSDHIELFEPIEKASECIYGSAKEKRHIGGVEASIKNKIEKMCAEDADETAKRILNKLIKQSNNNEIIKSLLPSLRQVKKLIYVVVMRVCLN